MASSPAVLGARALNRALLHRQWLSERRAAGPLDAVRHLVGVQAQAQDAPYFQLRARLAGFGTGALAALLTEGRAVRLAAMRGTVHLVAADEAVALRGLTQPFLDKRLFTSAATRPLAGIDTAAVAEAAGELLAGGPLPAEELAAGLGARFPGRDPAGLGYLARCLLPLVQQPPRGVWGEGGGLVYGLAEPRPDGDGAAEDVDGLVLRYLAAYGPASVADAQRWSGLTGLRAVFARLRPRLAEYRAEDGTILFDAAGAVLPEADAPVPPLLLGPFDAALLGHRDRGRILPEEYLPRVFTRNGLVRGAVLLDGFTAGIWAFERTRAAAEVRCTLFRPAGAAEKDGVAAEAEDVLRCAAPDAESRTVSFTDG